MKLKFIPHFAEKTTKHNGWWVVLEHKGEINRSWFSGPSDVKFDKQYLYDRGFWSIDTDEELAEFNRLYGLKIKAIKANKLKPVVVYECPHCKKLFKTFDRHNCKFNPKLKNCFSCKHSKGWTNEYEQRDSYGRLEIYEPPIIDCNIEDCDEERDIETLKAISYDMRCFYYEEGNYYEELRRKTVE